MGNDRVNNLLNTTLAGKITKQIAAQQKDKKDVIKADEWNKFIGQIKTGNTINKHISLENAMNSITKYAVVEAKKQNRTADDVAKEWYNLLGMELSKQAEKPQDPKGKDLPEIDPECEKGFYREDGTLEYKNEYADNKETLLMTTHYRTDGKTVEYIEEYSPETGNVVKSTDYTLDEQIDFINESNEDGQWTKQIGYRKDGTVEYVNEYNPEQNAQKVSTTHYLPDGETVESVDEYSPETGKVIKTTNYAPDGEVLSEENL